MYGHTNIKFANYCPWFAVLDLVTHWMTQSMYQPQIPLNTELRGEYEVCMKR